MQLAGALAALLVFSAVRHLAADMGNAQSNPLGKVLSLVDDLAAKITKEAEEEAKAYETYAAWCEDMTRTAANTIKTSTAKKGKLEAEIGELGSSIDASSSKIEELASAISVSTADLKSATTIREKEGADFSASEKELVESVDTIERAVAILQREMQKNPASFAQMEAKGEKNLLQSLSVVVDAAAFSVSDRQRLMSLAQSQQSAEEDDAEAELGAPAVAAYKTHGSGIFDVLEDLKTKAETQLSELRQAEVKAKQNFEMLQQSLQSQLAADNKDMKEEKAAKAEAAEGKAAAEAELERTARDLKGTNEFLDTGRTNCMQGAVDEQANRKARAEELKVITQARKLLTETTQGAAGQAFLFL
mmetsp:Transcript_99624/g.311117  ORF Transcript_99624/g.311117 Transcript_99624/m.311117 type:complete len:361 (+) Transcript_99624:68-1150(+)